ncbi:RAMP superfamily CRISPR-associated protein [Acidianus manzaensis]|uniref:CRISPR type III-associated protein domain-containing protein n=1 Tax=Acidianus manzaensis TaxID=282676 RepID=A0A1W6JWI1_9CREN|nr:RAMP superfamily CRISPR-associated protein [Acidianus manzaensis]ARM74590.1 hypothetical protein B6F84_00130 [Acidianus manzaensis]
MTNSYLFLIKNETPLVINYATGNYFKSLNYIPASSIIGALKARMINNWGEKKENVEIDVNVSDAYPANQEVLNSQRLNAPSLVTLYKEKEESEYYVDGLKDIIDTYEGKVKWGEKNIRLKKGPENWYYKNGKAYSISTKRIELNILKLDDYTKNPFTEKSDKEVIGYIAHVEALAPTVFAFSASGNINVIKEALQDGIYVGSFKTKGYGLVKLVDYKPLSENKESNSGYLVLDFYGNFDYDAYLKLMEKIKDCKIIYKNVSFEKRKRYDYGEWILDYVVRSGSVIVVKNCENLYTEIMNINNIQNGGRIVVNHPIHGL